MDFNSGGRTLVPAGSVMRGVVTSVDPAPRVMRRMTLSFDQLTVNGRAYPMRGTVTQAIEGEGIKGATTHCASARVSARLSAVSLAASKARSREF